MTADVKEPQVITPPPGMEYREVIPKGFVKTVEGQIIPRDKACFMLKQDPTEKDVERAIDGTAYMRDPKTGALKRMTMRKGEGKKK